MARRRAPTSRSWPRTTTSFASAYLAKLAEDHDLSADQVDANLASHFIDPAPLRSDDFEVFLSARRDALLAQVADVMGKGLVAVPEEAGEPVEDEEFVDDPELSS